MDGYWHCIGVQYIGVGKTPKRAYTNYLNKFIKLK